MSEARDGSGDNRPKVRLEDPTILGRVVGFGALAARAIGSGVDLFLNTVADIVVDAEKAFKDGMDPNVEDAKIIDEKQRPKGRKPDSGASQE
ncbi:MAG: hypothetical protein KDD65_07720 [Bacteroidetes bacterium]|nr:hypothetical protein [Bacteroidota bacterium]